MTEPSSLARRLAALSSLAAAMVLTGANVVLAKAISAELPVYMVLVFRFLLATVALAVLARHEPGPRLKHMTARQGRDLAAMAVVGMVGFTALLFEGLKRTSAADAGIITATLPAVAALLGILVMGERVRLPQIGAVALAVAGLLVVETTGAQRGSATVVGNLLVVAAVLCEASFVILGKRLAPPYQPLRLALGANVVALIFAAPLALLAAPFDLAAVSVGMWLMATWYALSASVFCLWLWYRGLPEVETWLAGLTTAAVPVTALAASALILAETIDAWTLVGGALVLAAIGLGAVPPSPPSKPRSTPRP
ncbi:MAG TPA: DMT family transporter [Hyphomicrobiaceae bacterium]|nr:DMT family transporter [Hyphomicrobiaceae bacterium]